MDIQGVEEGEEAGALDSTRAQLLQPQRALLQLLAWPTENSRKAVVGGLGKVLEGAGRQTTITMEEGGRMRQQSWALLVGLHQQQACTLGARSLIGAGGAAKGEGSSSKGLASSCPG